MQDSGILSFVEFTLCGFFLVGFGVMTVRTWSKAALGASDEGQAWGDLSFWPCLLVLDYDEQILLWKTVFMPPRRSVLTLG